MAASDARCKPHSILTNGHTEATPVQRQAPTLAPLLLSTNQFYT